MDYNLVWGIYWVLAWFFAVGTGASLNTEKSLSDASISLLTGVILSGVIFGVGAGILNHFIG